MTETHKDLTSEWTHELDADQITSKRLNISIEPNKEAKAGLCRRLDLHKIISLIADFQIQRNDGNMVVHIQGTIKGEVEQKCIVTLEPVLQNIQEEFEAWYADETQAVSFARAKRDRLSTKEKDILDMIKKAHLSHLFIGNNSICLHLNQAIVSFEIGNN